MKGERKRKSKRERGREDEKEKEWVKDSPGEAVTWVQQEKEKRKKRRKSFSRLIVRFLTMSCNTISFWLFITETEKDAEKRDFHIK